MLFEHRSHGRTQDFSNGSAQTMVQHAECAKTFVMPNFGASPAFHWPHPTLSRAPYSAVALNAFSHEEDGGALCAAGVNVEYFSHC